MQRSVSRTFRHNLYSSHVNVFSPHQYPNNGRTNKQGRYACLIKRRHHPHGRLQHVLPTNITSVILLPFLPSLEKNTERPNKNENNNNNNNENPRFNTKITNSKCIPINKDKAREGERSKRV